MGSKPTPKSLSPSFPSHTPCPPSTHTHTHTHTHAPPAHNCPLAFLRHCRHLLPHTTFYYIHILLHTSHACPSHTLCVHPAPPHTDPLPRGLSYFSPSCLLCTACSFLLALHPSAFSSAPLLSSPSLPHTRTHTPPTLYSPPTPCPSGTMTSAVPRSSSTEQRARPTPTSPSGAPRQRPEPSRPSAAPPLCL